SSGIEQVNRAVSQMDEVTQQNAALVEEAAAAAGSLQEQAQRLAEAVAVFKINTGEVIEVPAHQLSGYAAPLVAQS
ncbi:methyl-accepting chemotaxis protein, partial [Bordetella parapertussis]|nr:methyl-accepting chemotaxis protein [Bordetella parapertussis]MEB2665955.1 methyl-accepting chemotaxis protein [Bordetella parapertussis]MEB2670269.1 methyl-accepting chemotaxis protein [Bordetella parapertussis]